ncbi:TldD/PmbA family protein [Mesorhizobium sp. CA18]|uniref:TldD/PmbA family protein n=1 Tax=unclassified Mesorhizobium TaxID=325217 RepID=UPI001CCFCC81|nr:MULTISPECIES: TldD/PmbA family protein [unclassified Mesorhizobium]MBZ9734820.1 TldD/PmbA family protein [Mesorhizobium sp. CA9]MBZ9827119.1 TldD/PmbA family protein [Mesorhizobium sp. CA18]MBZ9832563.1 TldD/PmbA family protein [Mesorhizobium sp. CA2]MBZ9838691.1 TldD/PmbA family protein [Mesorhizobium sp. CA3]MBZ9879299.1 TldD/PmbA family protein [Mesorhizobium sp. Ca11]
MTDKLDAAKLTDRVAALVEAARRAGADAADAVAVRGRSAGVSVRLGKVEGTESSESEDVSLRVFVGQRVASVSATAAASDPKALAERAVAMARVSPEDPFQGLADPALLARNLRDLDLFDPTEVSADELKEAALAAEAAALAVKGVTNSSGSSAGAGLGGLVLATSHGFVGQYVASRFSRSTSVIAGEGTAMERDYEFSSRQHFADLDTPEEIGRKAGERTVRRLGARKAKTGPIDVVFDPRVARGIAGHLAGAINGAAVARKTSFLRDMMGKQVASAAITVTDEPLRRRGQASRPFDGEGIEGEKLLMVEKGILNHWFLSTSAARELGLVTNGRGSRSGSSVSPSSTNLAIEPGERSPEDLIASLKSGFYVTEVFGQGVDMVTGEYSRGASGYWIENGALAYPVAEVTIASNLKTMFLNMVPANDLDRNFGTAAPTLLIEGMTLAGA